MPQRFVVLDHDFLLTADKSSSDVTDILRRGMTGAVSKSSFISRFLYDMVLLAAPHFSFLLLFLFLFLPLQLLMLLQLLLLMSHEWFFREESATSLFPTTVLLVAANVVLG